MSKRQITIKPSCMREILSFPADRATLLWEKINLLVTDPLPDGKVKKKLQGAEGVYRLRVADHRVFYRFGEGWVSLLGVRRRREDTYREVPEGAEPGVFPPEDEENLDALLDGHPKTFAFSQGGVETPLPFELTHEWLTALGVPLSAHPVLRRCKSEEDLLDAPVASEVLARVIDAVFPPSLQRVAQQPDLLVPSTEHLIRYKEGDLIGFLLNLDEDQRKLTRWALSGPTMVTGGAGTGKSTVALYRVKELLERKDASGRERVLFTTYTRALLAVSRQLLEQILTPDQLVRVRVATCDQVAREIVKATRPLRPFEADSDTFRRLREVRRSYTPATSSAFEARLRVRALERLSERYLLEEFDWILTGRRLESLEAYLATPRPGRGIAFNERLRTAVWDLYQAFSQDGRGERFPELRNEALQIVCRGDWKEHWDYVLVDEAQDLSPSALSLMAEVCSRPEGLFFVADSKQSLYSRSYSWTSAHARLQFRGRSASLKRNYRSTREVEQAAFSVLVPEEGEVLEPSSSVHEGPLPVLVRGVEPHDEADWILRFVRQMSRHLHLRHDAAALLVPTADVGRALAAQLTEAGMMATFYAGRDLDLRADGLKVMTLYSAKGLEFPMVVVAGFYDGTYPVEQDFDDEGLYAERMRHERRLLYVSLTRAMRGLMLIVPKGCRHPALVSLDPARWHPEEAR